jgi:hypothetical protein
MGAQFNLQILKATNDEAAKAEALEVIEQAAYDHGHAGYSGSFAECADVTLRTSPTHEGKAEAEEWLEENCQKWENALIVKTDRGTYLMGAWCSS